MEGMITKNFSWGEMEYSETAKRLGIDNSVPQAYKGNVERLCKEVLQPIREKWGKPIVISSGYRCERLNKRVGGVKTSQHAYGSAADIHTTSNTLEENGKLWDMIIGMAKKGEIKCRQIIFEYGQMKKGPRWIHVSVNDANHGKQENKVVYVGV